MSAETATRVNETPSIADRIVDTARHAVRLSHDVRSIASVAEDAIDDGVDAARRTARSVRRGLEKAEDDAAYYVRRQPLKTVGVAAGVGLVVGIAAGWLVAKLHSAETKARG